jgi:hypothetical protein
MIQIMKDSRNRWQPFMGTARIFWGMFTNDKWLQLKGSHQRRTSLLIPTMAFARTDIASRRPNSAAMVGTKGA